MPVQNVESVRCSGDEIFANAPKTLRQQICKGEYINLALLFKGGMELKDFCSGGSLKLNTDGGIEMKAKVCKDKIGSVEKWADAILIFASVYLTAYPDKALSCCIICLSSVKQQFVKKGFAGVTMMNSFAFGNQTTYPHGQS